MPGPVAAAYFYEELFGAEGGGDKEDVEPKEAPKVSLYPVYDMYDSWIIRLIHHTPNFHISSTDHCGCSPRKSSLSC